MGSSAIRSAGWHDERHGDHGALAHPAGELVRVFVDALAGRGDADPVQHLDGALHVRCGRLIALVQLHRLRDLLADGVDRVQGGHRLLEDHRDLVAADGADPVAARGSPARSIGAASPWRWNSI